MTAYPSRRPSYCLSSSLLYLFGIILLSVLDAAPRKVRPLRLVVFGKQYRGRTFIGLGDDPERDAITGVIYRQEPSASFKGQVVLFSVVCVEVAPIARLMADDSRADVILGQVIEGVRGCYDLTKLKLGRRSGGGTHRR